MKVAVVCHTQAEAVALAARLGMTQSSVPMAAEQSPVLGHRFTAVLIRSVAAKGVKDLEWWESLFARTTGPVYTLDQWADADA